MTIHLARCTRPSLDDHQQDAQNQTWFTYAVNLIRQIIRVRTIQSELDKIAVLLYNTVRVSVVLTGVAGKIRVLGGRMFVM